MLKICTLFLTIFCLSINTSFSQQREQIDVGVFVEDIHGIDYREAKYEIVFWLWINSKDGTYNFKEEIDIPNSTQMEISAMTYDSTATGYYHSECKIRATVLNKYDVQNYPFDVQKLRLCIEFSRYATNDIEITIDEKQSKMTPDFIEDWITDNYHVKVVSNDYGSNFGDLHTTKSISYSGVLLEINLSRNSWNLYYKSFITLFLSVCLASISLFYRKKHSEEKIGLIVGSLFTTVGNKYVTDDLLPIQNSLNLSDKLHLLTIIVIICIAAYAIFEQRSKIRDGIKSNLLVFFIFLFIFLSGVFYFTIDAIY